MDKQRIIFWVALLALPFLGFILTSSIVRRKGLLEEIGILRQETNRIASENERLQGVVKGVQSEVLKELEIRKKLNYAKPGEVLVLFISPSPTMTPSPEPSWWQRIFK